jgi:L-amino acid N-acyltransferase YncA
MKLHRTYPWKAKLKKGEYTFRLMTREDRAAVQQFARSLPDDDLMFLRKDITRDEVLDQWIENIEGHATVTIITEGPKGKLAGYASLHFDQLTWTQHLGEIRVVVSKTSRGIGLASKLVGDLFQLARERGLQRVVVNIPREQAHVQGMLEKLGFKAEALLTDWLMDKRGVTHDLLIMSCYVNEI